MTTHLTTNHAVETTPRPAGQGLLRVARAAFVVLLAVLLVGYAAGLATVITHPPPVCPRSDATPCPEDQIVADLHAIGFTPALFFAYALVLRDILVPVGYVSIGLFIFWRRPDSWLALSVALTLVVYALVANTDVLVAPTQALLGQVAGSLALVPVMMIFATALTYVAYTFPDGRFEPRWLAIVLLPPLVFAALGESHALGDAAAYGPVVLLIVLGLVLQARRYRRQFTPAQRQQAKWGLLGVAGLVTNVLIWIFLILPTFTNGLPAIRTYVVYLPIGTLLVLSFPTMLAISILRYHLWDIDLIIRRTLIHAALTGVLALVYVGSVALLQTVLAAVSGQRSELAIVLSTLVIAVLAIPLRRRIQDFVDRRFYRRKYDAAQTLAAFTRTARDEVDLDRLSAELVRVVRDTMQPEHTTVWLKPVAGREPALREPTLRGPALREPALREPTLRNAARNDS